MSEKVNLQICLDGRWACSSIWGPIPSSKFQKKISERLAKGWPQRLLTCPTRAIPRVIHKQSPCAYSSAPCSLLHKHTYSTLRNNVSSTSEPTYGCVFLQLHACFNTCRGRRAFIACVLLLYSMHGAAPLHACTGPLVLTVRTTILSLTAHAPSLPIICLTSFHLPGWCALGGAFPLLLHPTPSTSKNYMPFLHPCRGFAHVCLGLEHFGYICNPVGTTCWHHHSTGHSLRVRFFMKGVRSMWSICDRSWISMCCPTCRSYPGAGRAASGGALCHSQSARVHMDFFLFSSGFLFFLKIRRLMQSDMRYPILLWLNSVCARIG